MRWQMLSIILLVCVLSACSGKPEGVTWQEYAVASGNPSHCDHASYPDVCRMGFTQQTGDGGACAAIGDEVKRKTCMAYAEGTMSHAPDEPEDTQSNEVNRKGDCLYDSECPAFCDGDIIQEQGCNARTKRCVDTFRTDCSQDVESFGSHRFPKVCRDATCVRDSEAIERERQRLEKEKERLRMEMETTSGYRDRLIDAKDEANQNCLGGLSDATVILMNELATKSAGIIAGGVSVTQGASEHVVSWTTPVPDYINKGLDEMEKAGTEEQRLTLDEYITLNCQLNEYFGHLLDESDTYIDELTEKARDVDSRYDALPETS